MPRLGNEKLKNITPPMLDSLFAELQKSGNMEQHFKLKDKSLFNGMTKQALADKSGVDRTTIYKILRGGTITRKNAEKTAIALDVKLDKVFDDMTESKGLSGSSTNKLKYLQQP